MCIYFKIICETRVTRDHFLRYQQRSYAQGEEAVSEGRAEGIIQDSGG